MIGQQVGDFKILKEIGDEAMGTVFLGEHTTLKHKVAIKALNDSLTKTQGMRERFEREAQVLAKLSHPNITRLQNFYTTEGGCFIVTEFNEGMTLDEKIQRNGPVAPDQAAAWMAPVLRALGYVHSQGIIHRDLQPANIIITSTGIPKLLDFGMAKMDEGATLTMQGLTLGTVYYMSREQVLGKAVDARSDVYSAGATLYEAVTGKLPFWDEHEQKLVLKIVKHEPPAPSSLVPAIPKELEQIILKALSKDADKRYQTADDMAVALETFTRGRSSTAGGFIDVSPSANKAPAPPPPPPPPPAPVAAPPPPPAPTPVAMAPTPAAPLAAPVAAAPAAPAGPPSKSILNGLVISGLCLVAGSGGLGVTLLTMLPDLKVVGAAILGVGLSVGFVLLMVGILQATVKSLDP